MYEVYEVAAENGHRVRIEAASDAEAWGAALALDPDIEMGGVYRVDGWPIGHDGGDAEDAIAEGIRLGDSA